MLAVLKLVDTCMHIHPPICRYIHCMYLYESLLEEYFGDLLENGEQTGVMDAYPSLEERENVLHLGNLLVLL